MFKRGRLSTNPLDISINSLLNANKCENRTNILYETNNDIHSKFHDKTIK